VIGNSFFIVLVIILRGETHDGFDTGRSRAVDFNFEAGVDLDLVLGISSQ
jgi:hypothetical protein